MPRGPALGFVGHSPQEDSYLKSRDELLDEIVTLLGGRAAEEQVFGESYSGAADDLARVHAVCKQMVAEFGMGVAHRRRRPARRSPCRPATTRSPTRPAAKSTSPR